MSHAKTGSTATNLDLNALGDALGGGDEEPQAQQAQTQGRDGSSAASAGGPGSLSSAIPTKKGKADAAGHEHQRSASGSLNKDVQDGYTIGDDDEEEKEDKPALSTTSKNAEGTKKEKTKEDKDKDDPLLKLPIRGTGALSGVRSNIASIRRFEPPAEDKEADSKQQPSGAGATATATVTSAAAQGQDDAGSPATLSPNSIRSASPVHNANASASGNTSRRAGDAGGGQRNNNDDDDDDGATSTLSSMFPDLPRDVVRDVLRAHGGQMERAADALLAMSSSSGTAASTEPASRPRGPPPSAGLGAGAGPGAGAAADAGTENDEALARALYQQEQDAMLYEQERRAQQQQQQQQRYGNRNEGSGEGLLSGLFGGGGGGGGGNSSGRGGFGNLFSGIGGAGAGGQQAEQQQQPPRNYDTNNLAYQPRVRRTASNQAQQSQQQQQQQQSPGQGYGQYHQGGQGQEEAVPWTETFDKYAEGERTEQTGRVDGLKYCGIRQCAHNPITSSIPPSGKTARSHVQPVWRKQRRPSRRSRRA